MTAATGQALRRLGLIVEGMSMLGLLALRRGQVGIWKGSGLDPNVVLPVVFAVGLGMWVVGTVTIRRHRDRP